MPREKLPKGEKIVIIAVPVKELIRDHLGLKDCQKIAAEALISESIDRKFRELRDKQIK